MPQYGLATRSLVGTTAVNLANTTPVYTPVTGLAFKPQYFIFICTTAVSNDAPMTIKRAIKAGTATSAITVATFTIPVTVDGVGDTVRIWVADLADMDCAPGENFSLESDGNGVGAGLFGVVGHEYEEGPSPIVSFTAVTKARSGAGEIQYLAATAA
jgi:hypothetical protein